MKLYEFKNINDYKKTQEEVNIKKLHCVFANEKVIKVISDYINNNIKNPSFGICHGTRNGAEQKMFIENTGAKVIGTEISSTATRFPNTIEWDFHKVKKEWINNVDFIYSNAIDHSYDPAYALSQWISCIKKDGFCFIEYTKFNTFFSKADCFSASEEEIELLISSVGCIVDKIIVKARQNKQKIKYVIFVVKKQPIHYGLAPISAMKTKKFIGDNTICQTLREIHEATKDNAIKLKCRQTMMIAKSITYRAKAYKKIAKKNNLKLE